MAVLTAGLDRLSCHPALIPHIEVGQVVAVVMGVLAKA